MNLGTWKASTATCHSTITARCTIRMIAIDFADPPPPPVTLCSLSSRRPSYPRQRHLSTIWLIASLERINRHCERSEAIDGSARRSMDCFVAALLAMTGFSRPQRLQHEVDHVLAAGAAGGGPAEIGAEDRRQGRRVGEVEIAQA